MGFQAFVTKIKQTNNNSRFWTELLNFGEILTTISNSKIKPRPHFLSTQWMHLSQGPEQTRWHSRPQWWDCWWNTTALIEILYSGCRRSSGFSIASQAVWLRSDSHSDPQRTPPPPPSHFSLDPTIEKVQALWNFDSNTLFFASTNKIITKNAPTQKSSSSFPKSLHFGASGQALEEDEEPARPVPAAINVIGLTGDSIGVDWWDGSVEPGWGGEEGLNAWFQSWNSPETVMQRLILCLQSDEVWDKVAVDYSW